MMLVTGVDLEEDEQKALAVTHYVGGLTEEQDQYTILHKEKVLPSVRERVISGMVLRKSREREESMPLPSGSVGWETIHTGESCLIQLHNEKVNDQDAFVYLSL